MQTISLAPEIWATRLSQVANYIGNTPLVELEKVQPNPRVKILAKLEWQQMGASVKARPAFNIFKEALLSGALEPGQRLLDASSGNTGIAYGAIGAALGIPVTLCLPENASSERKINLRALGVEIIYTSPFELTDGAQQKAKELHAQAPHRYFYADQYANVHNWQAHYFGTAEEIFAQTQGQITHFVAGLGTTGTFTGTSRRLQELNPGIRRIALHPDTPLHGLEGWKHLETALVPRFYEPSLAHEHREVDTAQAYALIRQVAREEGWLLSPSSAANLAGALAVAQTLDEGVVVTVFPDSADKYSEVMKKLFA
ncbi:MAG: cysteine synthase family protein [Microscillaceae bacterium]